MNKILLSLSLISLLILPGIALYAATIPIVPADEDVIEDVVDRLINFAFYLLLTVGVVLIVISAFLFLTSAGEAEKVEKARNYLLYAIIGTVVGFIAKGGWALVKKALFP